LIKIVETNIVCICDTNIILTIKIYGPIQRCEFLQRAPIAKNNIIKKNRKLKKESERASWGNSLSCRAVRNGAKGREWWLLVFWGWALFFGKRSEVWGIHFRRKLEMEIGIQRKLLLLVIDQVLLSIFLLNL
jgi:hypothetical protein